MGEYREPQTRGAPFWAKWMREDRLHLWRMAGDRKVISQCGIWSNPKQLKPMQQGDQRFKAIRRCGQCDSVVIRVAKPRESR